MTKMPHLAAAFFALSLCGPAIAAEPDVPQLNISPTCRPLERNAPMQMDESRCRQIENDARAQLVRQWADFPPADRALCTQTATLTSMASYVDLLTCLEMKRDVARLPADRRLQSAPAGMKQ